MKIRRHRLNGRKHFHVIIISRSYRIRGRAARTQINSVAIRAVMRSVIKGEMIRGIGVKRNRDAVKSLTTRILQYSAIKISANFPPPYSTLNPETSSDSPSAKSKGARFVSASRVTSHVIKRGGIMKRRGTEWKKSGVEKLKVKRAVRAQINKRAIEIS